MFWEFSVPWREMGLIMFQGLSGIEGVRISMFWMLVGHSGNSDVNVLEFAGD
jgi:hypothetical protein